MPVLIKGNRYIKADFGIRDYMRTVHIVQGNVFMFFDLGKKFNNAFLPDGSFVWEARYPDFTLVPQGARIQSVRHVFVRPVGQKDYTYHGVSTFEERYSPTQDIFFF